MSPVDVMLWCVTLVAVAVALGIVTAIGTIVGRFIAQELAYLATYKVRQQTERAQLNTLDWLGGRA